MNLKINMNGIYIIYTEYMGGRISIRDKPYISLAAAERAQKRRQAKLAGDPTVKSVKIGYQTGISDIDVKNIIAI